MQERSNSKSNLNPHVSLDGDVSEMQQYYERVRNTEIAPFLIECLSPDLDFNKEWMIDLQQAYWKDTHERLQLIGNIHVVLGPPRCGKKGYVFMRKNENNDNSIKLIKIDCCYYNTEHGFANELVDQIMVHLQKTNTKPTKKSREEQLEQNQQFSKRIVIGDQIRLAELNKHLRAKPNIKFLFEISNADKLVEKKKQLILYNLLEWSKTEAKQQIGYVFITRRLDFIDKLEKRIKSRMNQKLVFLMGPRDEKIIKGSLIKRFNFGLKRLQNNKNKKDFRQSQLIDDIKKTISLFEKSSVVQKIIKQEQKIQNFPKQIEFFLQAFRLVIAFEFSELKEQNRTKPITKISKQFDNMMKQGYELAKNHLCPYVQREKIILQNMQFPQLIVMCLVRKMLIDEKPKISLKEMNKQLASYNQNNYSSFGMSFNFPSKVYQRALRNLKRVKLVELTNEKDIENAEIMSNVHPDLIRQIAEQWSTSPQYIKNLIN